MRELRDQLAERERRRAAGVGARRRSASARRSPRAGEQWDRGVRAVARYRVEHDVADDVAGLGPEPDDPGQRRAWRRMTDELQRARRRLGRALERDGGLERD